MHADGWARDYSHIPEIREGAVSSNMGHTGRSGEQYKLEVIHLRHLKYWDLQECSFLFCPKPVKNSCDTESEGGSQQAIKQEGCQLSHSVESVFCGGRKTLVGGDPGRYLITTMC